MYGEGAQHSAAGVLVLGGHAGETHGSGASSLGRPDHPPDLGPVAFRDGVTLTLPCATSGVAWHPQAEMSRYRETFLSTALLASYSKSAPALGTRQWRCFTPRSTMVVTTSSWR